MQPGSTPSRAEISTCAKPLFLSLPKILPLFSTLTDSISIIIITTRPVTRTVVLKTSINKSNIFKIIRSNLSHTGSLSGAEENW